MSEASADFVNLSADVVAAYVSHNSVPPADLPSLIASVHTALRDAANGKPEAARSYGNRRSRSKSLITANHLITWKMGGRTSR